MIAITNGQSVAENDSLQVYSPTGSYADTDLVLCSDVSAPNTPISMYQAQYIKYGSIVYQFNTPEDLGKAVLDIDPSATLDAVVLYQQQAARDAARAQGTLTPGTSVPPTDTATDSAPPAPSVADDTASTTPAVPAADTPASPDVQTAPDLVFPPVDSASTTIDSDVSTTTVEVPDSLASTTAAQ